MKKYTIYTDGAYSPTDEKGGIGFVILDENEEIVYMDSKQYVRTTNQRMELLAAIMALSSLVDKSDIELISDSAYLVKTMTDGWKRRANVDLWELMDEQDQRHEIRYTHVRGHQGNKYNEIADDLAVEARLK